MALLGTPKARDHKDETLLPTPVSAMWDQGGGGGELRAAIIHGPTRRLPTPRATTNRTSRRAFSIDHWSAPSLEQALEIADGTLPRELDSWDDIRGKGRQTWQDYAPAIERHAAIIGRPAPSPTLPLDGLENRRLSPIFVEWLMMLPEGWVTDLGLSRRHQLRILGNGVVPPQAAAAYQTLLQ